jgi:hypothetical protein
MFFPGPLCGGCEEKLDLGIYRLLWPMFSPDNQEDTLSGNGSNDASPERDIIPL